MCIHSRAQRNFDTVNTEIRFSARTVPYEPNPIAIAESRAQAKGHRLRKLNDSNPTKHGLGPAVLGEGYEANPKGPTEARRLLAEMLGNRNAAPSMTSLDEDSHHSAVQAESIYLLSSTSQAYSWLIKLLCDAGDALLVPKPGYPLVESIARLECVEALSYPLHYDGSWTIDIAAISQMLSEDLQRHIRALVLINPNNPTASYVREEERRAILSLCERYGVAIIADEVFFDYNFAGDQATTQRHRFAGEQRVLTFALDGFSKMIAAPHAKVAWIQLSGPDDAVEEATRRLDAIADDYLPMSSIIADRIGQLLDIADVQLARVQQRITENLVALREILQRDASGMVNVLHAEGGWNVLLQVPAVLDEDELVIALMRDHELTAQPGYFFDMSSNGFLALSLLPEAHEFRENVYAVLNEVDSQIATLLQD
jgi:aspartate/methionine/tyrosine aminotransferase